MTDYEPPTQDSIDLPTSAYRLGTDQAGRDHWHDPMSSTIWAFDDGELVQETDLNGRGVVEWVQYVDAKAGWDTRQPVEERGGLGSLVDDVREVLDA